MLRRAFCVLFLLGAFLAVSLSAFSAQEQGEDKGKNLPDGKGKDYVSTICQQCHGLEAITGSQRSLEEWRNVVNDMVSNGAAMQEDEVEIVSQYLAKNFGPSAAPDKTEKKEEKESSSQPKVNVNKSSAKDLETELQLSEKDAKAIVAYREKHGDFKNWDDLKKVGDVDSKKMEAAKERLEF